MMLPSHLAHFLEFFGPLWDQGLSTGEASGQIIKALYLATNRQSKDVCVQILTRFLAPPFLPAAPPAPAPPAPAAPALSAEGGAPNVTTLNMMTMHAPITATHFNAVWSAARSAGVPLPADSTINVEITWFTRAHLRRATSYKKVCDVAVRDGAVILQYNARDERVYGVRKFHDHAYQPVHTARLLRVKAFFTTSHKNGAPPRDYCLAQQFKPLLPADETERSREFSLYKPRTLAALGGWVFVPTSELSHPLRFFNFYADPPPQVWSPLKKTVPVCLSRPQLDTILVSTAIRW